MGRFEEGEFGMFGADFGGLGAGLGSCAALARFINEGMKRLIWQLHL